MLILREKNDEAQRLRKSMKIRGIWHLIDFWISVDKW